MVKVPCHVLAAQCLADATETRTANGSLRQTSIGESAARRAVCGRGAPLHGVRLPPTSVVRPASAEVRKAARATGPPGPPAVGELRELSGDPRGREQGRCDCNLSREEEQRLEASRTI